MVAPSAAYQVDITGITKLAQEFGGNRAGLIVRDELSTAMLGGVIDAQNKADELVKHKSGAYKRGFRREVGVTGHGVVGILTNVVRSAADFPYAAALEFGRKAFGPKTKPYLVFKIGDQWISTKWVKEAPAQHILEYGMKNAMPAIEGRFLAARDRIASRLEAMKL